MKRSGIVLGILLLVGAFFPAIALAAPATSQQSTVTTPHVHLLLTQKGYEAQKQQQRTGPHGSIILGNGDLVWHGGPVLAHPVAYLIFWGPNWNAGGGVLTADAQVVVNFFKNVGDSKYFNLLSQYFGSNSSAIANAETVGGIYLDQTHTIPYDTSCGGPTIEDSSIQSEVGNAISTEGWPTNSANGIYYVFTESGYSVATGFRSIVCSGSNFCSYHGQTFPSNTEVAYAAMPYPNLTSCTYLDTTNGNPVGDALANFASQENADAITDPRVGVPQGTGWSDNGFEIGDMCELSGNADGNTLVNGGHTFALQTLYSNASHNCQNWYTPQTAGVYRPSTSTFYLRNTNTAGGPDESVNFGASGDIPLVGDWTGAGFDSIGVYRPSTSTFYLKTTNTPALPLITIPFGTTGDIPVVGDFCGYGEDGIGVFRPSTGAWYVRCTATPGLAQYSAYFGATGDIPIVGDWNSDWCPCGSTYADGIGVYRPSTQMWYLADVFGSGRVDYAFPYGASGDIPVTGDYSSQGQQLIYTAGSFASIGMDTPGVFRPSIASFFLANQPGPVSLSYAFPYGTSTDIPLIGQWVSYGPGTAVFQ